MTRHPDFGNDTQPASEMPRPVRLDRLARDKALSFDESATAEECTAIATLAGILSVDRFRFSGTLSPRGARGWDLSGRLRATLVQRCVVSLDPVAQRLDEDIWRQYLPELAAGTAEIDVEPDDENEVEPLPSRLDLGSVAVEAAILALDPYPRRRGVEAMQGTAGTEAEKKPSPFAQLARLRDLPKPDKEP